MARESTIWESRLETLNADPPCRSFAQGFLLALAADDALWVSEPSKPAATLSATRQMGRTVAPCGSGTVRYLQSKARAVSESAQIHRHF